MYFNRSKTMQMIKEYEKIGFLKENLNVVNLDSISSNSAN